MQLKSSGKPGWKSRWQWRMTTMTMITFVTWGSFDSSVLEKKIGGKKKSVLVQTLCKLVFCLLKLASGITAATTTKMEGVSLHLTYFLRDTKRKHLFFFFKGKNKHWKNLLVLIMWKKNKTKQENPFSGVVCIVSTPRFTPRLSWFLCIALRWAPSPSLPLS